MVKRDYNPTSLLLRQYFRWLPAQLGLVNYGAFRLQINQIRSNDMYLVSYPKSGNTWLRYIVAAARYGHIGFSFQELEAIVPDVYVSKTAINRATGQRFIKTHDALFDWFPASVYIYRDVRDVMVSYYHYAVHARQFSGTFGQFLRSPYHSKTFGAWARHVQLALKAHAEGKNIHLVKYETLLQQPVQEIGAMLHFMRISPVVSVAQVADLCAFANLQSNEKEKGSYFGNRSLFFREGKTGTGRDLYTDADMEFLMSTEGTQATMKQLGYRL